MDDQQHHALVMLITGMLRIVGAIYCGTEADKLNRSVVGWVLFGLGFPIIAMIWISFLKPIIKFEEPKD